MPTVLDATVVASAYDTSGSGGRKVVMLDNGWLVSVVLNTSSGTYLYKSTDNGVTWSPLCNVVSGNSTMYPSISHKNNIVYLLLTDGSTGMAQFFKIDVTTQTNVNIWSSRVALETAQSAIGNTSIAINEQGTELHATWASKNSNYSYSFNIRYAKGTINADGSVTWGAVEQRSFANTSGTDNLNPSIVIRNGNPVILYETKSSSINRIYSFVFNGTSWTSYIVYDGGSYAQSSPSAIFVPQEIAIKNPLFANATQGVIAVAWHGLDSVDASAYNIRFAYSLDGGVNWTVAKLTSGNTHSQAFASLTFNKKGELFVIFGGPSSVSPTYAQIRKIKNLSGNWDSGIDVTNNTGGTARYPSTLLDQNVDFSEPLFIYQDNEPTKVGFYGTWTTTEISVAQGDLGEKTSKDNLLTYAITTDDTMSTITEKVNGVVIATKTATSGQNLSVGLTQAQWDAVRFGKYTDATGSKNTLTIEMGAEKWTYTFDKRLATDADVLSVVKAVKDSNEVQLPTIKKMLVDKVGGSNGDTFEEIIKSGEYGKKWASGTATGPNSPFITGLEFTPSIVYWWKDSEFGIYNSQTDRLVVYGKPTTNGYASMIMEAWPNNPSYIINSGGNFNILDSYVTNKNRANLNWLALE